MTFWHFVAQHVFATIGFAMGAILVGNVIAERRATGSTMAWLLAILLIPYVGVPFYLVFGGRKLRRKAAQKTPLYSAAPAIAVDDAIARMLCASGVPVPRGGHRVELLGTGEAAFAALARTVDGAQRSIHVSTLLVGDDEVGRDVLARLTRRAAAGVEVRLLVDALFGMRAGGRRFADLRRAGGRVASFMPVVHVPFKGHANLRLHRKIVVVDGREAIVGGMNLAREYMGPVPVDGRWRDLAARFTGPAVADVDAVFRADWRFAAAETLADVAPPPAPDGEARIQVVGSGPDVESDRLYDAFLSAIFDARRRLWLATPYFVPDEALTRAILLAVRRGVDVRVLVPARSNHLTADLAGGLALRALAAAGAKVCAYRGGMMHAKVVIVDDTLGALGSANLDMRSLFLDYEMALFFSTGPEIAALADWFESLAPSCGPLAPATRLRTVGENVFRLLGPLV